MIDHIIFDIDGTLTDGGIIFSNNGSESKTFQAKDGLLMRKLPDLGITTIIMTGSNSEATNARAEDLRISLVFKGVDDKAALLRKFVDENALNIKRFAYIGDDLNDYSIMKLCAFKACPIDAVEEIRGICDYISTKKGGYGAVRDICEYLLRKQNQYEDFLRLFIP